jgi:hypothetical protein
MSKRATKSIKVRQKNETKSRQRRRREDVTSNQAKAALNRYHHIVDGAWLDLALYRQLSSDDNRDADAVACALILIRRLLDDYTRRIKPQEIATSGLTQSYDLLDALATGRDWQPFWRFIASLRTETFRPQRAPPTNFETQRRSTMAGFARALQKARGLREAEAIREVIKICQFPGVTFTENQIRKWGSQSNDQGGAGPDNVASMILGEAKKAAATRGMPFSDCVAEIGHTIVHGFWSVPDFR